MKTRKIIAALFLIIAAVFGVVFYLEIEFPTTVQAYFKKGFYGQFGRLAISVELWQAGIYLFKQHSKANFALALFGFTVLLDSIFNLAGFLSNMLPVYAMIIFVCCALLALWLAFTDTFGLGRISVVGALLSLALGTAVELVFNYW